MKLLADVHIAPRTVDFLRTLGHDVVRVPEVVPASAPDEEIIRHAFDHGRIIVTQDLDFSALLRPGRSRPPLAISPRGDGVWQDDSGRSPSVEKLLAE